MSENSRSNSDEVPRKSTYETAEGSLPIPAYILKASRQVYTIDMIIQKVIDSEKQYDLSKIVSAYELAERYHHDQKRESGEPYISHPIAVAYILLELGMDTDTICAALLHDVVEDTDYSLQDLQDMGFGDAVIDALKLLTHDPQVPYMEYVKAIAENPLARKVKLADLEHNSDISRLNHEPSEADLERRMKYMKAMEILKRHI